jgi:hypothetical protein
MLQILGRLLLGKLLTDPKVKGQVMSGLKELIDDPDSDVDETAVSVAEDVWDVVIGVLVGNG